MRPRNIKIDRGYLEKMYLTERRELSDIAKILSVSAPTVSNRIKEFGLTRPASAIDMDLVRIMYLDDGETIKDIAKYLGFSRTGLRKVIVKAGILKPRVMVSAIESAKAKRKLTEEELRQMYLVEGKTDAAIARECGVGNIAVAVWRRKYNVKREPLYNALDLPVDELKRMYVNEKMNMEDIAKHFNCGESTVRSHIIRNGFGLDSKEVSERRMTKNREKYSYEYVVDGYKKIQVLGHPMATAEGYIGEHRYIAEQAMGRYVQEGEQVHHINIDKSDNRVENLGVLLHAEHSRVHKYMERVAAYMCHLTDKKPEPVKFDRDVFWGGKWVRQIDLAIDRDGFNKFEVKSESVGQLGHMAFIH